MEAVSSGTRGLLRPTRMGTVGLVLVALLVGLLAGIGGHSSVAGAAGPTRVITYEVRGLDNGSDLEAFAAQAAETYRDSVMRRAVAAGGPRR